MSESTAPNPVYDPDEYERSQEPALRGHSLPGCCELAELPAQWIVGLYGADTSGASAVTVDIDGHAVRAVVISHTADPQRISATYAQVCTVVHRYIHVRAAITAIASDLPPQIASVQWHTPGGDVTLIRPRPGTHRRRKRLGGRFLGVSPLLAACAWWAHKAGTSLRGTGGAVAATASVVTIAGVTAIGPAAPPPSVAPSSPPHPARSRQADLLDAPPALPPSPGPRPSAATQPAPTPSAIPQPAAAPSATGQPTAAPSAAGTPTAPPTDPPVVTVTTPVKTHLPAVHVHPTKQPRPVKTKKAVLPDLPAVPSSVLTP